MSNPPLTCILCRVKPPIENSHIVPKFVIRRLKNGSPLDTLIHSDQLKKVFYDGWKGPYLCAGCELDFSKIENWFCTRVYDPFDKDALVSFQYDENLLMFGASLIFRSLHLAMERNLGKPETVAAVRPIYENLRTSLLAKSPKAITSALYIDFFAPITTPKGMPPGINQHLFRAMDNGVQDWNIPPNQKLWTIFAKLPGMNFILVSPDLIPPITTPNAATKKIGLSGTMDPTVHQNELSLTLFADEFRKAAFEEQANYDKLPEGRVEKMAEKIKNSASIPNSSAERAYLQDMTLLMECQKLENGGT